MDPFEFGEFRHDVDKALTQFQESIVDSASPPDNMKIGRKVPLHGGNGKQIGGIHVMRLHHKDGLNTNRTEKFV